MTLTLEVPPYLEDQLREVVSRRDIAVARRLLADAAVPVVEAMIRESPPRPALNAEEFDALLEQMIDEAGSDLPSLSEKAVSREGLYEDHL